MKCLIENFLYNGILIFACKNRNAAKRFESSFAQGYGGHERVMGFGEAGKNFPEKLFPASPISISLYESSPVKRKTSSVSALSSSKKDFMNSPR